jgi:galactose-1-phosphate uridylyltransferase
MGLSVITRVLIPMYTRRSWNMNSQRKNAWYLRMNIFLAFCPFASRAAFEIWIVGKRPSPYFERINDDEKFALAEALQRSLQLL